LSGTTLEQLALSSKKAQSIRKHAIINGSRRLLEFTELPLNQKKCQIGYAVDVTEGDVIAKEYALYKKHTEETFNRISVPIAIFDYSTKLVFANDAMSQLFDLEKSYITSKPYFREIIDFLIERKKLTEMDGNQSYRQKLSNYFRDMVEPYHTFLHTPDSRSINVVISPNHDGGLVFICEDITDKITIERNYNTLSAVQTETLNHLHDGIFVFGTNNRIKMINPSVKRIWGPINSDCNDMHVRDFFTFFVDLFPTPDDCEEWIARVINMCEREHDISGILNLTPGKSINYTYVPLPDGLNLIQFVDVTDRVNLERALIDKNEVLSQTSKLKSNFLANISHEVKYPINTVLGFTELLINQYFGMLNDRQIEYCSSILSAIHKLSSIMDSILGLASVEAGENKMRYTNVHPGTFLQRVVHFFDKIIESCNIGVEVSVNCKEENIYLDEKSMKSVVSQLLSMILQKTPFGGSVMVAINGSQDLPNHVDIIIKNKGVGTPLEEIERLQKMIALNKNGQGSATTISDFSFLFANYIVELHDGEMFIKSDGYSETEITLRIPSTPSLH
jgi:signal transduction histidine kinase